MKSMIGESKTLEGKWLCQADILKPESIIHKSHAKRQTLKCSPHIGVTTVRPFAWTPYSA